MKILLSTQIDAPPELVFARATDFANAADTISGITRIEMLTPGPTAVGTRFRETRVMFGKEHSETLEVTALDPGRSVTLGCMSCGAEYVSEFRFEPSAGGTHATLEVNSKPVTFMAKLMVPVCAMMKKSMSAMMAKDLDDLKTAAERDTAAASQA
ncbi:MAG: SRPBCC family protein [Phycisphaeraceae bacterium]|nr:SRPBCC family protein [Phycisphaeraceae bacterium]MCW5764312.1 SRPBCC family protein [Phycisphaeraceae bacterium]